MFGFISANRLRSEARSLIEVFAHDCPPPTSVGKQVIPEKKIAKALDVLYAQAAKASLDMKLGILGRARFAKVVQDELRRVNYTEELISRIVSAVTTNALAAPRR